MTGCSSDMTLARLLDEQLEAIRLDPYSGDSYGRRGSALVALGRCREAVTDAEESLRHGESEGRLHYSGARIIALAAESAKKAARPHDPSEMDKVQNYQDRALALLGQAVERTPLERRAGFWREVVHSDHAFTTVRRQPAFARTAAAACQPQAQ
jgi:hypothetical protein